MRTPDNDKDLVLGLLYAEDIYKNKDPLVFEVIEEINNDFPETNVLVPLDSEARLSNTPTSKTIVITVHKN